MRWLRSLSRSERCGVVLLGLFLVLALIGPLVWGGRADEIDLSALNQGSSWAHPFGTDALGRDMLARTLVATRLSLGLALITALLGFGLGVLLGLLPFVAGARLRGAVSGAIGLLLAFPGLLLALIVATIVGVGAKGAVIALAVAAAPAVARLTQTLAAGVGGSDYVAAARVVGVRWPRLMLRHVLPNIAPPIVLQLGVTIGGALLALSALSFLGIGVQQPDYDWGALLNAGLDRIYVTPSAALGPAAAIALASLAFNLVGDALADTLAGVRHGERPRAAAAGAAGAAPGPTAAVSDEPALLRFDDLKVAFQTPDGVVTPVAGVSVAVRPGERIGIVGESGSGKTLTALALADLVGPRGTVEASAATLDGDDLIGATPAERGRLLATSLGMVFQDPLSSLNPALRVGRQVAEGAEVHLGLSRPVARRRAGERLRELRIAGADRVLRQYPHELSGGMRQRAAIAMGTMTEPRIVVADEPTTALDVTVQRRVLGVLRQVSAEHGTAIVLISHDISVVAGFCDRVLVMYAGRIVEEIEAERLADAAHPYTRALLAAVPDMETDRGRPLATIPGRPPSVSEVPPGCPFAPRCKFATERCVAEVPPLERVASGSRAACWHPQGSAAALAGGRA